MKTAQFAVCVAATVAIVAVASAEVSVKTLHAPSSCDKRAAKGLSLDIRYEASVNEPGEVFDSNHGHATNFGFPLGRGYMLPAVEQSLENMCVGEKREVIVPAHLAFEAENPPDKVPADAAVKYVVGLFGVYEEDRGEVLKNLGVDEGAPVDLEEGGTFAY